MENLDGMRPLNWYMELIHSRLAQGRNIEARLAALALPVFELIASLYQFAATPCRAVNYVYRRITEQDVSNSTVLEGLGKACQLAANILIAPIYGLINPKNNYLYHLHYKLIDERKPAPWDIISNIDIISGTSKSLKHLREFKKEAEERKIDANDTASAMKRKDFLAKLDQLIFTARLEESAELADEPLATLCTKIIKELTKKIDDGQGSDPTFPRLFRASLSTSEVDTMVETLLENQLDLNKAKLESQYEIYACLSRILRALPKEYYNDFASLRQAKKKEDFMEALNLLPPHKKEMVIALITLLRSGLDKIWLVEEKAKDGRTKPESVADAMLKAVSSITTLICPMRKQQVGTTPTFVEMADHHVLIDVLTNKIA